MPVEGGTGKGQPGGAGLNPNDFDAIMDVDGVQRGDREMVSGCKSLRSRRIPELCKAHMSGE